MVKTKEPGVLKQTENMNLNTSKFSAVRNKNKSKSP